MPQLHNSTNVQDSDQKTRMTIPGPERLEYLLTYQFIQKTCPKYLLFKRYSVSSKENQGTRKHSMKPESGLDEVKSESCGISVRMEEVTFFQLVPQHLIQKQKKAW